MKNGWILLLALFFCMQTYAHDGCTHHGHGPVSADCAAEAEQWYKKLAQGFKNSAEIPFIQFNKTSKVIDETNVAYFEFKGEKIPYNSVAFAQLSHDVMGWFEWNAKKSCPKCTDAEINEVTEKVKKSYLKKLEMKTLNISAWMFELSKQHGIPYLIYTVITEALESSVLGAGHLACTFFQHLYVPVALVGSQFWGIFNAEGSEVHFRHRVAASWTAFAWSWTLSSQLKKLWLPESNSTINHKDYLKLIREGKIKTKAQLLDHSDFWHLSHLEQNSTSPSSGKDFVGWDRLKSDLDILFDPNLYVLDSEKKRFFIAYSHGQAFQFMRNTLSALADQRFESGQLSTGQYFKLKGMLGRWGKSLSTYKNLFLLYSLKSQTLPAQNLIGIQRKMNSLFENQTDVLKIFSEVLNDQSTYKDIHNKIEEISLKLNKALETTDQFQRTNRSIKSCSTSMAFLFARF